MKIVESAGKKAADAYKLKERKGLEKRIREKKIKI